MITNAKPSAAPTSAAPPPPRGASRWLLRAAWAALGLCLFAAPAAAQEAPGEAASNLAAIADVIRWAGVFVSAFVIGGASIALRFVSGSANRLSERFTARRLLIQKFESIARFVIYIGAAVVVGALCFKFDKTALTLIGGSLALAIGFAMRDLVAAVIAGITIMFDRPFQVGDRVAYAGQYGDIMQIGLRSVRMRTLDDNIVTIPNNKILTDVTASGNYGQLDMQLQMDFFVGVDQDLELAERLVTEAILTSRYVFLDKPVVVLIKQVIQGEYLAAQLRGKAYVLDTKYEKAFETDVHRRVLRAFRDHRVKPPAVLHRHLEDEDPQPQRTAEATPSALTQPS